MKLKTELLSGSAAMVSHAAIVGWLFCLSKVNDDYSDMGLSLVPVCAFLLFAYLANCAILRWGTAFPVFAAANVIMCAFGAVLFVQCAFLEQGRIFPIVQGAILYVIFILVSAYIAYEPTNRNGLIIRFDIIALLSLVAVFIDHFKPLILLRETLVLCVFSMGFIVFALVAISAQGRGSAAARASALAGRFMVFGAASAVFILTAAVMGFTREGFSSLSQWCFVAIVKILQGLSHALDFLYSQFDRFLSWLSQFISSAPVEDFGELPTLAEGADFVMDAQVPGAVPLGFYIALADFFAVVVAFIIFRFRKARIFVTGRVVRRFAEAHRESFFWKALLNAAARALGRIVFEINYIRHRKTAAGLLVFCERKAKGAAGRRKGESSRAFLTRLSEGRERENAKASLLRLADLTERAFYSENHAVVSGEDYKAIRAVFSPR